MEILENHPLIDYNFLRLDVRARYFAEVTSVEELVAALRFAQGQNLLVEVIGEGSNVLFCTDFDGLILHICLMGKELHDDKNVEKTVAKIQAGENWHEVVTWSLANRLYGLENLSLIPGTAGAAPLQNIGAYGAELSEVLESVEALDRSSLDIELIPANECGFGYRTSHFKGKWRSKYVITQINLKLSKTSRLNVSYQRVKDAIRDRNLLDKITPELISQVVIDIRTKRLPDPVTLPNVGSFFKNPVVSGAQLRVLQRKFPDIPFNDAGTDTSVNASKLSAAWLIEQTGLKNQRVGGAEVSPLHALVLVNTGGASSDDFVVLADHVKSVVDQQFGIQLQLEPVLI